MFYYWYYMVSTICTVVTFTSLSLVWYLSTTSIYLYQWLQLMHLCIYQLMTWIPILQANDLNSNTSNTKCALVYTNDFNSNTSSQNLFSKFLYLCILLLPTAFYEKSAAGYNWILSTGYNMLPGLFVLCQNVLINSIHRRIPGFCVCIHSSV